MAWAVAPPLTVLPSKLITRLPRIVLVRSHIHAPITASIRSAASLPPSLWIVDSDGTVLVTHSLTSTPAGRQQPSRRSR
jgi:hypothetical protein